MYSKKDRIRFMRYAIDEAYQGIELGHGGPFGCVIIKDGEVVGYGHNEVIKNNDPTCHGEIQAIRNACKRLGTFDLSGCDLYTTGECCTGCLCFSMWANINHIYYGATLKDNEMIGFRDDKFNDLLGGREKLYATDYCTQIGRDEVLELYEDYKNTKHRLY